jgi:flavin-dependent dehydrogenase
MEISERPRTGEAPVTEFFRAVINEIPHFPSPFGGRFAKHYVDENNEVVYSYAFKVPRRKRTLYGFNISEFVQKASEKAVEAGVELRTATAAIDLLWKNRQVGGVLTDNGEEIPAHITIAADGFISTLARKAGLVKKRSLNEIVYGYSETFPMKKDEWEKTFYGTRHTFLGPTVAPRSSPIITHPSKQKNTYYVQVCVLALLPHLRHNPKWYMQNLKQLRIVTALLDAAQGFPDRPLQTSATTFTPTQTLKKMYTNGLLVIGDAAGIPGVTAPAALYAAELAARAIKTRNYSETMLREYQQRFEESRHGELIRRKGIAGRVAGRARIDLPADKRVNNMYLSGYNFKPFIRFPRACEAAIKLLSWYHAYRPIIQEQTSDFLEWLRKNWKSYEETRSFTTE